MQEIDKVQMKKDMAECPAWILNSLKSTTEKSKMHEKQFKECKEKLEKLLENTQQWKLKVEKEMMEKDKEIKELKELLKKEQQAKQKFIQYIQQHKIGENDQHILNTKELETTMEKKIIPEPLILTRNTPPLIEKPEIIKDIDLNTTVITKMAEDGIKISFIKAGLDEFTKGKNKKFVIFITF